MPSGALRGSCPSLLQQVRGSQDLTLRARDVCFRPLVEELRDDFFTGFAHGKLVQVQPPPQPMPNTQWNNPFMNVPINFQSNVYNKPHIDKPLPDIVGPRYRPHSYGAGEEYSHLPRPFSPMIEENKNSTAKSGGKHTKKKHWKKNEIKGGSCTLKYSEYIPKVMNEPIRPNSHDDKKGKAGEKMFIFHSGIIPDTIVQSSFSTKVVDLSGGFLDKVKKEALQLGNN